MMLEEWNELPAPMKNEAVRKYYDILQKKRRSLLFKHVFDIITALLLLLLCAPVFAVIAVLIKIDSAGTVFFRQKRVTQYGRNFRIYKFRTMVWHAESIGAGITAREDARITGIGRRLRSCRLDELPQLINILKGEMSFVGTRPEIPEYVAAYTDEMRATLLLPAGVTSEASIKYKDEAALLSGDADVDAVYTDMILPGKMRWNLASLRSFSLSGDLTVIIRTVRAVMPF